MPRKQNRIQVASKTEKKTDGSSYPGSQSRLYSITSSSVVEQEEAKALSELVAQQRSGRLWQTIKMIAVVAIPVLALICLAAINLSKSIPLRNQSVTAQRAIENIQKIDILVTRLQVERGRSASYISSDGKNKELLKDLQNTLYAATDAALGSIRFSSEGLVINFVPYKSSSDLKILIDTFRPRV
jgi:hypothetical protein